MLKRDRGKDPVARKERNLEHELKDLEQRVTHLHEKFERDEDRIRQLEARLHHDERRIKALEDARHDVLSITIIQNKGENMAKQRRFAAVAVVGVVAGQTGNFSCIPAPAQSAFATPPSLVSDNPLAVVTSDPSDPTGATFNVAVDPTASGSFNLTPAYTNPDGVVAVGTPLNVPVIPGPPPPPVDVATVTVQQNS